MSLDLPWKKIEMVRGDLLLMPGGYFHCVWTRDKALAYGGNFLTWGKIAVQAR
jgi:hypothetical protein